MKRAFLVGAVLFVALALVGCGGGDGNRGPTVVSVDILSEGGVYDGDITRTGGVYSVVTSNQSPNTVLVDFQAASETRGFITFSLASIPVNASIRRATVFLPIFGVVPIGFGTSVPLTVDMVSFPALNTLTTQTAMGNVFNTAPLLPSPGASLTVLLGDVNTDRTFDATGAVIEANRLLLSTLQIGLLSGGGHVEIDDLFVPATGAGTPMLRVEYF